MNIDAWRRLIPWEPSPTVALIAAATALLYLRGCRLHPPSFLRRLAFWSGFLLLYAASHTQFDYYAEHEFFMHRIQHSILHHIGPFLIALSRPGATLAAGLPRAWRRPWPFPELIILLNRPVMAVTLFCGLILFWLIPSVHFIAMLDVRLYRLMNWSMALNGVMFWSLALNNRWLNPAGLTPACRIGMMLAIIPPQIAIGMLIFATPHELYPIYSLCGRAFGITPLEDQQIGGLILWVSAAMMSAIGMLLVIRREWMTRKSG